MASEIPKCCDGCEFWERHGQNCHYYWELKKNCTMFNNEINPVLEKDL